MPHKDRLMTPTEVASLFQVNPRTISRWADAGRLQAIITPSGHRKYRESDIIPMVQEYLAGQQIPGQA